MKTGFSRSKTHLLSLAIISCLTLSSHAVAITCYEPSPTIQAGDDVFDYKPPETLSTSEQKKLQTFLSRLQGSWQGTTERTLCTGSENNARKKLSHSEINMTVEDDSRRSIAVRSDIYMPEKKSRYSEKFSLHQVDGFLRMDSRGADGNIELIEVEPDQLTFLQRYFVRKAEPEKPLKPVQPLPERPVQPLPSIQPVDTVTALPSEPLPGHRRDRSARKRLAKGDQEKPVEYSPGGVLNEVVKTLTVRRRSVTIETTLYTNGYLASSETWQLR